MKTFNLDWEARIYSGFFVFMSIVICTNTKHVWRNLILLFIAAPFLIYIFEEEGLLIALIIALPFFVLKQFGLELTLRKSSTEEEKEELDPFATSFDTKKTTKSEGPKDLFEKDSRMFPAYSDFIGGNEKVDELGQDKDNSENTDKVNKTLKGPGNESAETSAEGKKTNDPEDEANLREYMDFFVKCDKR